MEIILFKAEYKSALWGTDLKRWYHLLYTIYDILKYDRWKYSDNLIDQE